MPEGTETGSKEYVTPEDLKSNLDVVRSFKDIPKSMSHSHRHNKSSDADADSSPVTFE